jgi:phosphotriesterase-related protein
MDVFESVNVDVQKLCIGHLADLDDPKALTQKAIAKRGAFVGFDTVGIPYRLPEEKKVRMIVEVLEAGYEDHILLSHDFGYPNLLKSRGDGGYSSALTIFVPKLRYAGVDSKTVRKMLVENPRRFLSFKPTMVSYSRRFVRTNRHVRSHRKRH